MSSAPTSDSIEFDHIAIGVPDDAEVARYLERALGGRPCDAGPGKGFRWWQWEYRCGERLEVLRPDGPPGGFLHRFLDRRGAGLHHVTFKVPNLDRSVERAGDLGFEVLGFDDSDPFWKEAFLHPKQAGGMVVQLAQVHARPQPSLRTLSVKGHSAELEGMGNPAAIVGLRSSARDLDEARRLWSELLEGRERSASPARFPAGCEGMRPGNPGDDDTGERETIFEWPSSPMRIALSIDPELPEGPLGIEIAGGVSQGAPAGHSEIYPALGVRFIRSGPE